MSPSHASFSEVITKDSPLMVENSHVMCYPFSEVAVDSRAVSSETTDSIHQTIAIAMAERNNLSARHGPFAATSHNALANGLGW